MKKQMSETNAVMILMTLSGGLQDAYSYFVRGKVFANAQTGNIVLMASKLTEGDFAGALRYLIPLTAFALGVLCAEQIRGYYGKSEKIHWRQLVIIMEFIMLCAVGFMPITEGWNVVGNALTSFACAMQVQAFRKVNGHAYASTMCIGNLRAAMESLSAYLRIRDPKLFSKSMQYFLVIFVFLIGSAIGFGFANILQMHLIWISCMFLMGGFLMMWIPTGEKAIFSEH